MSIQNNQPPLEEVLGNMRDNILRSQSQASTAAITSFDNMVAQLKIFAQQINDKNTEINDGNTEKKRLQELCKKNNIDYAIPPLKADDKISTVPKTRK